MPRKTIRSQEEEEAFQQNRRQERAERQRFRRLQSRHLIHENNRTTQDSTPINIQNNTRPDYLGKLENSCQHCHALHFKDEMVSGKGLSFNDCCGHGSVFLDPLLEFPEELKLLLKGEHRQSVLFFERIRAYNNSLSFASFNANLVNFQSRRPGPYCFKIQGQVYYQINTSLYPCYDENPSYGQLFIIDQEEAINYRMNTFSNLNQDLNIILDTIIRENNVFAQSYHMMRQKIVYQQELFNETDQPQPELQLLFSLKPGQDRRRYNFQRINEVAAIFATTADGEIPESYVTIRNKNTKSLQCVSTMDPKVEPWIYPLFYPYGRRLFQQWVVDSYVKIEKDRIQYCKDHQQELRSDTYKGLSDYMQNSANNVNGRVGKSVILPSTFIGSPRYMQQCYQDSMALVNEKEKPNIFLTMTCNPNWVEIQENLLPGQQAFIKKKLFGEVTAYVYVIEFQKRGLPHMHLLITLSGGYKWTTAEIIDKFISAEIPNKTDNSHLHNLVINHMTHGPCGDWCMKDGECSKHFPKQFQNETTMNENGYPHYQRRNDGITVDKTNDHVVDNRWVVPYCPILLKLFDCHINIKHLCRAVNFEHLRTVDNVIHPTFIAACLALGLIENDDEWNTAMNEGVQWMMPQRLRFLFVRILIHCQPVKPEELWTNFQDALSEDFSRTWEKDIAYQIAYQDINSILNNEGKSLNDLPSMPPLLPINILHVQENISLQEMADRGNQKYNNLNPSQKEIVDLVINAVDNENYSGPTCIFMEGPGGSGKIYVYETM
ncbi:uncharacterized protein LOC131674008 [Phymastichus coffea]|uniref:uncharacterized protein LOC131674008 n=1 Tax=Phymastichus coffea TaxID=108790 RepID=UPI00273B883D|nr:uncharacterized protein LOC131674008 [Phymastichus coffea]